MDRFIEEVAGIADAVAARRGSNRRIALSFDEWNVWYRTRRTQEARTQPGWPIGPPLLEEIYTVADALAVGGMCVSLLNHSDRVKIACLAQLVNAIAPIMTRTGGGAWRQTTFYSFAHFSRFGRQRVLRAEVESPTYSAEYYDPRGAQERYFPLPAVPYVKLAAVHDAAAHRLTVFALNRSLKEDLRLELQVRGFAKPQIAEAIQLHDVDLNAVNSVQAPDRIVPQKLEQVRVDASSVEAWLQPASWSVIQLRVLP